MITHETLIMTCTFLFYVYHHNYAPKFAVSKIHHITSYCYGAPYEYIRGGIYIFDTVCVYNVLVLSIS